LCYWWFTAAGFVAASGDLNVEFLTSEEEVRERAARIKLLILDVDGVLTDGGLVWHANGQESKVFHVHDGHGIRLLQRAGIEVALLTGRGSHVVDHRARDLGITLVVQESKNKLADYEEILQQRRLDNQSVAYVGDDLVDVPVFRRVGLAVAVANGASHIRPYCQVSTLSKGGQGAVREVCEFLLQVQGKWQEITAVYFSSDIA
jgi:3-deoxy-D-manno-octulosonate 8-phosphate phosphatase (KDO 8-P phosphatase)